ncbi:hypothetical protein [Paenibacillus aestuarii]|uniref:Sporulation protein YjcZ n=1 Tax=Paenibacillus aestuarii TaxID=516965 RepID=A0ABW0K112_9BACL|nr:hypothetical protein [Paenibacillus aestuarii]
MEVKPGYVAPGYQPMPMPAPMPMPMPMPMPAPMPVAQAPAHNDIHLHASYQQTQIVFPKPAHVSHAAPVAVAPYSSAGSILVLFILLVIITRGFIGGGCKC